MKLLTFILIVILIFGIFGCSSKNPTGPNDLTNQLVAYYPFNGNANDESGNGYHGTINGAILITDRFGNQNSAFSFDGNDDYIDCGNHSSLNFNDTVTVSAWVNAITNRYSAVICNQEYSGYGLYMGRPFFQVHISGEYIHVRVSEVVEADKWYHLVGIYDGNTLKLYLDSVLSNSVSAKGQITKSPVNLFIGANPEQYGPHFAHFHGIIDDIRIYNRTLTNDEIQKLYHEGGW